MINERSRANGHRLLTILLVLAVLWTLWASLVPASALPPVHVWDKLAHTVNYALLTVLLLSARPQLPAWISALVVLAFGGAIELAQARTGYRSADWYDMLANLLGVSIGLLVILGWRRWRRGSGV